MKNIYELSVTTQGPLFPPSEIMDEDGNFVVVGYVLSGSTQNVESNWQAAIVSPIFDAPPFGSLTPYKILRYLDLDNLGDYGTAPLYTLPLPIPCNNYNMLFAPQQHPGANSEYRDSLPLHQAIPDFEPHHSRQYENPITLENWLQAKGTLTLEQLQNQEYVAFDFEFENLVPKSLYTVMSLRSGDLDPLLKSRPSPLGIPNCFTSDDQGAAHYSVRIKNPFPENGNRIINVVVLFMSSQCSHGGAIGRYGLGGDIHAQLKLKSPSFFEFKTGD